VRSATGLGVSRRSQRAKAGPEWIWGLDNVSFDVEAGEVIGIMDANGAGKNTRLKVLSHITDPTFGYVRLRGRASSLLEVGTGFHPDLTGRETFPERQHSGNEQG